MYLISRATGQQHSVDPRDRDAVVNAVRAITPEGTRDLLGHNRFDHLASVIAAGAVEADRDGAYNVSMAFANAINTLDLDIA